MSSHGDSSVNGRGRSASPKISSAQIICIQVVPHLEGVEITMSPGRNSKPSHRALSANHDRYRRLVSAMFALTHEVVRSLIGRLGDPLDQEAPDVTGNVGRESVQIRRRMARG